jgi:hypothetical protein
MDEIIAIIIYILLAYFVYILLTLLLSNVSGSKISNSFFNWFTIDENGISSTLNPLAVFELINENGANSEREEVGVRITI